MSKYITQKHLQKALTYGQYKNVIDRLLLEGKTSGPEQTKQLIEYTKINVQRMHRNEKTVHLKPELVVLLQNIDIPVYWVVLSEAWCGDSAQITPILAMMADASPNIDLRILFRDENPDVMEGYLTNGNQAIPKLICLRQDTLEEIGTWGPRPQILQDMVTEHKKNPMVPREEFKKQIHLWYAKNKGEAIQSEFIHLIHNWCKQFQQVAA